VVATTRAAVLTTAVSAYERKDAAYRRAKQEGYRSRAAYKLEELDRRFKLLARGGRVVDLGCWPGGWLQVAARRVGPTGRVVGVDVKSAEPVAASHVVIVTGDLRDDAIVEGVRTALGGPADVVLSDLAPKLSGIRHTDAARHADLVRLAIARSQQWLSSDGILLVKLFMDAEYEGLIAELRERFETVRSCKPGATRRGSAELYAIARRPSDGKEPGATEPSET
jgi:23S rRNA (uridine2552-2'-O)-methyltransferase